MVGATPPRSWRASSERVRSPRSFRRVSLSLSILVAPVLGGCQTASIGTTAGTAANCVLVEAGHGPEIATDASVEVVAEGLDVPWGLAFLPGGDILVTERAGRLRLVRDRRLLEEPLAVLQDSDTSEGGLLGIALHPSFEVNGEFFLYRTVEGDGRRSVNRVERWRLDAAARLAQPLGVLVDNIPAAAFHNGGRLRIGPDGMLYIGTGDARNPDLSQDPESLAGKLLRIDPVGSVPSDNPDPGSLVFLSGLRNLQAFDWQNDSTLWVADHGPSGELGRRGHDEVSAAQAGDNLGWPTIFGCETAPGLVSPSLSWSTATPPGGAAFYSGSAIPEWAGSLLIGTLGSTHLQRIVLDEAGTVTYHEVLFRRSLGRLRDVVMGPDGHLYVTTSNCDGRGSCPSFRDRILRIGG